MLYLFQMSDENFGENQRYSVRNKLQCWLFLTKSPWTLIELNCSLQHNQHEMTEEKDSSVKLHIAYSGIPCSVF